METLATLICEGVTPGDPPDPEAVTGTVALVVEDELPVAALEQPPAARARVNAPTAELARSRTSLLPPVVGPPAVPVWPDEATSQPRPQLDRPGCLGRGDLVNGFPELVRFGTLATMLSAEAALRARGLVKRYKRVTAVDRVDITVGAGERVALLGPNGAGKTTTLLMLLGVITPDEGWVEIVGHRLPRERSKAAAHVGFAAGYLPLPERLRVGEFLRMFARLYGVLDAEHAVRRGLDRFRISNLADAMGNELSSGQRTLVGIVKATLHQPALLVLDEPTASLDPDVAQRVRSGLERSRVEDGAALLVTSHNMTDVERLCDRVVFLSGGRVVADGAPVDVAARYGHESLEGVFLELAEESGS
jgi:ABC-2 type transport system ATP-binding protein